MVDINDLISKGYGDIHLTVTANDLLIFAQRIVSELKTEKQPEQEDELMTRQQVMEYLGIKPTTLFIWGKKGILVPRKIGRKRYYSKLDILALQQSD